MADLRKWGIEQESTHDLVKLQMRWQIKEGKIDKRQISTNRYIKGLAKYSNEMTKRGMLVVGDS